MLDDFQTAELFLGPLGRMISASKTGYRKRHPDHAAIFNANVCISAGKIWYGDLDLTCDEARIAALARSLSETVFVLYERDGRFRNERSPLLESAVYRVDRNGISAYDERVFHRDEAGVLRFIIRGNRSDDS